MRVEREVRITAQDKKLGMTADELMRIIVQIPGDVVPVVEISMKGKIKAVKVKTIADLVL